MSSRRLALTLLVVGSFGILGCSALTWASATVSVLSGAGTRAFTASGSELIPQLTAWAVLALAGSLALISLRGWLRQLVGVLIAGIGVVLGALAISFGRDPLVDAAGESLVDIQVRQWWLLVLLCAGLVIAAGVLSAGWSRPWPALGSRYEGEGARRSHPASPWDALDAGRDPTMSDLDAPQPPA